MKITLGMKEISKSITAYMNDQGFIVTNGMFYRVNSTSGEVSEKDDDLTVTFEVRKKSDDNEDSQPVEPPKDDIKLPKDIPPLPEETSEKFSRRPWKSSRV